MAPSAVPPNIPAYTSAFQPVPPETPRALTVPEIGEIVRSFGQAARNAMKARFDGIELQAANSHLIEQFLEDGTNQRTDEYGGTIANRTRFLLEVVEEVSGAVGKDRLGVRLWPFGRYAGIRDSNPFELFRYVIEQVSGRIAYLHLIEARGSEIGLTDELNKDVQNNAELFRAFFDGPLISTAAYSPETASQAVERGHADAIAFGRFFLANPDLVDRIRNSYPMNPYDRSTFYGGAAHGYTDYGRFATTA